ncbi:phosphodiester glycosidase family protein [Sorangium sp. So ce321]|uniref:phosphodiester glycosidase family protein n=1 Tax=Sorangium sp. So ce321 TaxID=3133300 RepID=UPI003F62A5AD
MTPSSHTSEGDACKNVVRVLATSVITREKGKPEETALPFEVKPEAVPLQGGTVPVCVSVTSVEAKPRVLASGRFMLDGEELLGPSAFNQNTETAAATRELGAGSHMLTARIASAPGTKLRVYVYQASTTQPLADAPVLGRDMVLPDRETRIVVAGATFTFPAGAVDAPVPVIIYPRAQPYGLGDRFELMPDGLRFEKPVPVEIPYDPSNLPPTQTEAELLARDALRVLHDAEWRPTTVDPASRTLRATIEHFSAVGPGSVEPITRSFAGYDLTTDDTNGVYIASFPLGQNGYRVSIHADLPLPQDPNPDPKPLPADYAWHALKPVTEHVKQLHTEHIAINATPWGALTGDPDDDFRCGEHYWCAHEDEGRPRQSRIGIGTFSWSVRSTENIELSHDSAKENERLMVIGASEQDGLEASLWPRQFYDVAKLKMDQIKAKPGGHAVMLGSTIWPINKFAKPSDTCTYLTNHTGVQDDENTVVAIYGDPKCAGCKRELRLISSMSGRHLYHQLCSDVLTGDVWDAIVLDGGNSTAMVRNGQLFDEPAANEFKPARNVANAFAISYTRTPTHPRIDAPACAVAGVATDITVATGTDPDGYPVKVHCGSADSNISEPPYVSPWAPSSGSVFRIPMTWSRAGSMKIYCTTFNANHAGGSTTVHTIQVGEVYDVQPRTATLGALSSFSINGNNLCSSTVAWIPDCTGPNGITLQTSGGAQQRTFACTPGGAPGPRAASVIKTKAGGTEYLIDGQKTFTVTFAP